MKTGQTHFMQILNSLMFDKVILRVYKKTERPDLLVLSSRTTSVRRIKGAENYIWRRVFSDNVWFYSYAGIIEVF